MQAEVSVDLVRNVLHFRGAAKEIVVPQVAEFLHIVSERHPQIATLDEIKDGMWGSVEREPEGPEAVIKTIACVSRKRVLRPLHISLLSQYRVGYRMMLPLTSAEYQRQRRPFRSDVRLLAAQRAAAEAEIAGQRFGGLTALGCIERPAKGHLVGGLWLCRCDCGEETDVRLRRLRDGHNTSCGCGCYRASINPGAFKPKDHTGQRFGGMVAIQMHSRGGSRNARWLMRCDCGNTTTVTTENLGRTKSCGCLRRRASTTGKQE